MLIGSNAMLVGGSAQPIRYKSIWGNSSGDITTANAARVTANPQVGDLIVLITNGTLPDVRTSGGSNWTLHTPLPTCSFWSQGIWTKILNATDVANTWLIDNSVPCDIIQYAANGATTVTFRGGTGGDFPGSGPFGTTYAPAATCRGQVTISQQYPVAPNSVDSNWVIRGSSSFAGSTANNTTFMDRAQTFQAGTWNAAFSYASATDYLTYGTIEVRA